MNPPWTWPISPFGSTLPWPLSRAWPLSISSGAWAAGTDTAASDVDLGILYESAPASRLDAGPLDLEGDLERRLGRSVHLVVLNSAPADLRIRVLRAERLLIERNRSARIRFEVATRNEFFDLEPRLLAYRAPRGGRQ